MLMETLPADAVEHIEGGGLTNPAVPGRGHVEASGIGGQPQGTAVRRRDPVVPT